MRWGSPRPAGLRAAAGRPCVVPWRVVYLGALPLVWGQAVGIRSPGDWAFSPGWGLSRATSLPLLVVKNCVQGTVLLDCSLLRNKERVPFAFRDIGVLTCKADFLCMKFYLDCVTLLESTVGLVALLHSVSC